MDHCKKNKLYQKLLNLSPNPRSLQSLVTSSPSTTGARFHISGNIPEAPIFNIVNESKSITSSHFPERFKSVCVQDATSKQHTTNYNTICFLAKANVLSLCICLWISDPHNPHHNSSNRFHETIPISFTITVIFIHYLTIVTKTRFGLTPNGQLHSPQSRD